MASKLRILLSRTDSIGDVILTLPMAGVLKANFPDCQILFLGRTYTKSIIELSEHVDGFVNYDEILKRDWKAQIEFIKDLNLDIFIHVFPVKEIAKLAKAAGVPRRAGTRNRLWHWLTCSNLIKLSRKNSELHESQLNMKLLSFLNIETNIDLKVIQECYGFSRVKPLGNELFVNLLDKQRTKVILHPKSKGSAKEWGLTNFSKLIQQLPKDKFQIFISGTKEDGLQLENFIKENPSAIDITGKLSLDEFISFINLCDVLVAASTGPLHIAAALGKKAIGLYSPKRPIHPGRWAPVGKDAHALVFDENCENCKSKRDCNCIEKIEVQNLYICINAK
ncbi:MAG: glycosyltransferase family 9 protein [Bacteroidia bacterium]|jgi:heptosyltransferase III|nr:glycosyltransferase family 9 protein [Bacteroidia bacterium]